MTSEKHRYFLELKASTEEHLSRMEENERRREQALAMIVRLRDWLHQEGLESKVSTVCPTLFGQVQITCAADVLRRLREEDDMPIVAVRQGEIHGQRAIVRQC